MVETQTCPSCETLNEVKVSSGFKKPENKGRKYFSCIKCAKFHWIDEIAPTLPLQVKTPQNEAGTLTEPPQQAFDGEAELSRDALVQGRLDEIDRRLGEIEYKQNRIIKGIALVLEKLPDDRDEEVENEELSEEENDEIGKKI